jgi:two-component system, chemotaxis family, chemotaxis protein CheY
MAKWLLLLEEDPEERENLAELMKVSGLEIAACANVEEAHAAIESHGRPNFVVTDLAMLEVSGLGFVAELRQRPGYETVPVAFLTDAEPALWADVADPVVKKPVDAEHLLDLVAEHCNRTRGVQAV